MHNARCVVLRIFFVNVLLLGVRIESVRSNTIIIVVSCLYRSFIGHRHEIFSCQIIYSLLTSAKYASLSDYIDIKNKLGRAKLSKNVTFDQHA